MGADRGRHVAGFKADPGVFGKKIRQFGRNPKVYMGVSEEKQTARDQKDRASCDT